MNNLISNYQTMIHLSGLPQYLETEMPDASLEIGYAATDSIYDIMRKIVGYISRNIAAQNYRKVKQAFRIADRLYKKGDRGVKNAVQNIVVFSFTRIFISFPTEKNKIIAAMPAGLFALYIEQIEHPGC